MELLLSPELQQRVAEYKAEAKQLKQDMIASLSGGGLREALEKKRKAIQIKVDHLMLDLTREVSELMKEKWESEATGKCFELLGEVPL